MITQPQTQTQQLEASDGEWLFTREATVLLRISRTSLLKYQSNGYLKQGKHWIKTGPYKTSPTLWNTDSIWQTMASWGSSESTGA